MNLTSDADILINAAFTAGLADTDRPRQSVEARAIYRRAAEWIAIADDALPLLPPGEALHHLDHYNILHRLAALHHPSSPPSLSDPLTGKRGAPAPLTGKRGAPAPHCARPSDEALTGKRGALAPHCAQPSDEATLPESILIRALDAMIHGDADVDPYRLYRAIRTRAHRWTAPIAPGLLPLLRWSCTAEERWHREATRGFDSSRLTPYDIRNRVAILLSADLTPYEGSRQHLFKQRLTDRYRSYL